MLVGTGFCKVKKMFDVELFVFGPLVISALSLFRRLGFGPSGGIFLRYHFYVFGTLVSALGPSIDSVT